MFRKCKWIQIHIVADLYKTSCGHIWDVTGQMLNAYKYCPCCGKRITITKIRGEL